MITQQEVIRAIPLKKESALWIAEACYQKWMGDVSLADDVAEYLNKGCVVTRPNLFALARVVEIPLKEGPQLAWFIRMVVGDLEELLDVLPFPLKWICFCRRNDGRMRVYSLDRLTKKIRRRKT
jgi:hypothetical protein